MCDIHSRYLVKDADEITFRKILKNIDFMTKFDGNKLVKLFLLNFLKSKLIDKRCD